MSSDPVPIVEPPTAVNTEVKKKKKKSKKKAVVPSTPTTEPKSEIETIYLNWLKENKINVTDLSIFSFPDTGRGLKAERNFAKGEKLLTIPQSMLITARSVRSAHALKPVFHAFPKTSDDNVLAIFLMYEKQIAEKNGKSHWTSHIQMQPQSFGNILYFSKPDIQQLKGSNLQLMALKVFQQVEEDYKEIFPKMISKFSSLIDAKHFTIDIYKWALAVIWSRAFDLLMKGQRERTLVPFADMFNHSFNANVEHKFDESLNSLVFSVEKPVEGQSQVFFCYDPTINNARLLRLYGFCIPNNPNDIVDIYAPLNPAMPLYQPKKRLLTKLGIEAQSFPISSGGIPSALLNYLRIRRIEDEEGIEVAKQKIKTQNSNEMISVGNESIVLMELHGAITNMLQHFVFLTLIMYPTTLEEDVKLLETLQTNPNPDAINTTNILILRVSEKRILQQSSARVLKLLEELQNNI